MPAIFFFYLCSRVYCYLGISLTKLPARPETFIVLKLFPESCPKYWSPETPHRRPRPSSIRPLHPNNLFSTLPSKHERVMPGLATGVLHAAYIPTAWPAPACPAVQHHLNLPRESSRQVEPLARPGDVVLPQLLSCKHYNNTHSLRHRTFSCPPPPKEQHISCSAALFASLINRPNHCSILCSTVDHQLSSGNLRRPESWHPDPSAPHNPRTPLSPVNTALMMLKEVL